MYLYGEAPPDPGAHAILRLRFGGRPLLWRGADRAAGSRLLWLCRSRRGSNAGGVKASEARHVPVSTTGLGKRILDTLMVSMHDSLETKTVR